MGRLSYAVLQKVFLATLTLLSGAVGAAAQPLARWERVFPETVNVVVVQNPAGRTEVEVVAGPTIHAAADAGAGQAFDEEAITVDQSAPGVVILRVKDGAQIHLRVTIPSRVVLSVLSASGEITVRGVAVRILAESKSGNVMLHLPPGLDADFSFKTTGGQVLSGVALAETAGNTGSKGRPVIHATSMSGNIVLLPLSGAAASVAPPDVGAQAPLAPQSRSLPRRTVRGVDVAAILAAARANRPVPESLAKTREAKAKGTPANDGRVRVNSDLVLMNAYVVDPKNLSVPDLRKEDFTVTDNGTGQEVAIFEPVQRPLELFLLLDLSGSTKSKFDIVKKAVKKFIDTLAPTDRIAIAGFTSRFMMISEFTSDRKLLKKRIDDAKNRGGGTEYYLSMWNTLDLMAEVQSPRRAIVVMTDGVDNALQSSIRESVLSFDELLERVRTDGISIYPIYLNTEYELVVKQGSGDSLQYKEAREQLQALADATGTTLFRAERFEDLAGAYDRVAAELRNLYTIGFYPTLRGTEGEWHDVKVAVNRSDATVRARKGYFAR